VIGWNRGNDGRDLNEDARPVRDPEGRRHRRRRAGHGQRAVVQNLEIESVPATDLDPNKAPDAPVLLTLRLGGLDVDA
jgi:hypothetical protein